MEKATLTSMLLMRSPMPGVLRTADTSRPRSVPMSTLRPLVLAKLSKLDGFRGRPGCSLTSNSGTKKYSPRSVA